MCFTPLTSPAFEPSCEQPLFMSPELAMGQPYDTAADVWAFGCVLYSLTTLVLPWLDQGEPRGGMMGLMRRIATGSLDLSKTRQRYSPGLCELIAATLAKAAAQRPTFKDVLEHPLVAPALAAIPSPPPLPRAQAARRRVLLPCGAAAATVAAAVVARCVVGWSPVGRSPSRASVRRVPPPRTPPVRCPDTARRGQCHSSQLRCLQ